MGTFLKNLANFSLGRERLIMVESIMDPRELHKAGLFLVDVEPQLEGHPLL